MKEFLLTAHKVIRAGKIPDMELARAALSKRQEVKGAIRELRDQLGKLYAIESSMTEIAMTLMGAPDVAIETEPEAKEKETENETR